jgi:tetratricopeptide (TPR) repeat protein
MLETIREFAAERFEVGGDQDQIRRRHLDFFLALAEEAYDDLEQDRRSSYWLELIELEHDNCRASFEAARELGERRLQLRLASALSLFWSQRSHLDEGRRRIAEALACDPDAPVSVRGNAMRWSALMARKQGDFKTARALAQEAAAAQRAAGDVRGLAHSLNLLGMVAVGEGDYERAKALYDESLSIREQQGDEIGVHDTMHNLGLVALEQGDFREARRLLEAALALGRTSQSERSVANSLTDLGFAVLGQAQHEEARAVFEESLRQCVELGWKEAIAYTLVGLAAVSTETEDLERAARILSQAESLGEEIHLQLEKYAEVTRERTEQELQSRLGDSRFASCRTEGRSMPLEEAVALALADVD